MDKYMYEMKTKDTTTVIIGNASLFSGKTNFSVFVCS